MANHVSFTFDDPTDGLTYHVGVGDFDDQSIPFLAISAGGGVGDTTVARIEIMDALAMAQWILREFGARK